MMNKREKENDGLQPEYDNNARPSNRKVYSKDHTRIAEFYFFKKETIRLNHQLKIFL